jgi:hypothetical protein
LPEKPTIRRIGGEGYENWVFGVNHKGERGKWWSKDCGDWRLEVSPATPAAFDNFLFLLLPCDGKTDALPPAQAVQAEDGTLTGLAVNGWLTMFGRRGSPVEGTIRYKAPADVRKHLVCDLLRSTTYTVRGAIGDQTEFTVGAEGTLRFDAAPGAGIVLVPINQKTP